MGKCWVCDNELVAIAHAIFMYERKVWLCAGCKNNIEKGGK